MLNRLIPLALIVGLVLACVNSGPSNSPAPIRNSTGPAGTSLPNVESQKSNPWDYSEYTDQMGRGRIIQASIVSTNTISLGFPYEGAQHGTLSIREHPQHGKDVYLTIEKGQLLDSDYHGNVLVRFDSDKPRAFTSVRPADLSSDTLFLRGDAFPVFISRLKTAKTLRVEVPVYQGGNQVFVFDVEGFSWKKQ